MRVLAYLNPLRHAFVDAILFCPHYSGYRPVRFLLDTGSTVTTLLDIDIVRLGIDCSILNVSTIPRSTANGIVYPHMLPSCSILFEAKGGFLGLQNELAEVRLEHIDCLPSLSPSPPRCIS